MPGVDTPLWCRVSRHVFRLRDATRQHHPAPPKHEASRAARWAVRRGMPKRHLMDGSLAPQNPSWVSAFGISISGKTMTYLYIYIQYIIILFLLNKIEIWSCTQNQTNKVFFVPLRSRVGSVPLSQQGNWKGGPLTKWLIKGQDPVHRPWWKRKKYGWTLVKALSFCRPLFLSKTKIGNRKMISCQCGDAVARLCQGARLCANIICFTTLLLSLHSEKAPKLSIK